MVRLSRIEELAASFAEIEGRGTGTSVFQEMTRILDRTGRGRGHCLCRHPAVFHPPDRSCPRGSGSRTQSCRPPATPPDRRPVPQAKGQATEARNLYTEILAIEPDWPEVLHAFFWFLTDQGDLARVRTTTADARSNYEEAHHMAQTLAASDPGNTQWQRDLWVSFWRLADLAERRKKTSEARTYWKQAFEVLAGIDKRGLHLSPEDRQSLETLRQKTGADAG